jgi:serine/threonine protein kinase
MSTLETWLAQLLKGALEPSEFSRTVHDAVSSGTVDRASLRRWLISPTVKSALPPELARDLAELSVSSNGQRTVDGEKPVLRRPPGLSIPAAPDPRAARVNVGSVIDDRYELLARLGGGGMGDVFKALDLLAHKQQDPDPYVAIKILKPKLQGNDKAVLALQREANRARRLTHPNILRIHQFEHDRATGLSFIVMELLEGRSLESFLEETWAGQPWSEVSHYLGQICAGLQCAHQENLIHSDIKPGNLFLTTRGQIKILDFGIAAPMPSLTGDGHQTRMDARKLGARTPAYASLETFLGMKAHYSDDVYSLACVTYQWLSGSFPYVKAEDPGTPVPSPKALKLGLKPAPLPALTSAQNRALRRALALQRSERTQTVEEFWKSMTAAQPTIPTTQIAAAAAGILLGGIALLGAMFLLPHRDQNGSAHPDPASVGRDSQASVSLDTRVATQQDPAAVLSSCPGPPSRDTLDAALGVAVEAQNILAKQRRGSTEYAQAQSRLRAAAQCLRALASAGVSNAQSSKVLAEVDTFKTP